VKGKDSGALAESSYSGNDEEITKKYKRLPGHVRAWKIVHSVFPQSTSTYYNAILHLSKNHGNPIKLSWAEINRNHINKKKRDYKKWDILLHKLVRARSRKYCQKKGIQKICWGI
jgi:hypothetical protein